MSGFQKCWGIDMGKGLAGIHKYIYQYPNIFSNPDILHTYRPMEMEQTECSETSAYIFQTPGNYPEGSIIYLEHGENLKSRMHQVLIYAQTDAPLSCLKKILKFTLKQLRHVSVLQLHHHQGAHYFMLTEVPPPNATTCFYELSWFPSWLWR